MRLLLDEMYPSALADALAAVGIQARTVVSLGLAGSSDAQVFAAAGAAGDVLLTENVADFASIAAQHTAAGAHHPGVLLALSSRFSRRAAGRPALIAALQAISGDELEDRVVYLPRPDRS